MARVITGRPNLKSHCLSYDTSCSRCRQSALARDMKAKLVCYKLRLLELELELDARIEISF